MAAFWILAAKGVAERNPGKKKKKKKKLARCQHCGEIPCGVVATRRDVYGSGRRRTRLSAAAREADEGSEVGCQRTSRKENRMRPSLVHPTHIYDALRTRRRPACTILRRRCRDKEGCRDNGGDVRNVPRITACKLYAGLSVPFAIFLSQNLSYFSSY